MSRGETGIRSGDDADPADETGYVLATHGGLDLVESARDARAGIVRAYPLLSAESPADAG